VRPITTALQLLIPSFAIAFAIVACVGDDPVASTTPDQRLDSGGGGGGSDSSTNPADGGLPGTDSSTEAGDAGGDGATPPYDVRTLAGLRLWLESTQGLTKAAVGNDVVSWRDSSNHWLDGGAGAPAGGAHLAVPVAYSGGGAVYPSVVASGPAGRPTVSFETGPKLAIDNHDDFNVGTGDFAMAAVSAISSGTGPFWRLMTASTAPSGNFFGPSHFCSFLGGLGAQPKCTSPEFTPSTSVHVFMVRRKTAQMIFRVDGTSRGTYDFGVDNPDLGVATYQQASAFIGGGIVGQLSELMLIVGGPNDAEFDKLEKHLTTKYGIP
jgi:hypothetical protein